MQVLVVAAHHDDEVMGCGGTIARHAAAGDQVHLLIMADGVTSRDDPGLATSGLEYRNDACRAAANILGISTVQQLGYPDNAMDTLPLLEVVKQVESVVRRILPHTIYTHHLGDLNIDHRLTHEAVITACRPQPDECVRRILTFEVLSSTEWQSPSHRSPFVPNHFVEITAHSHTKLKALNCYQAEMRDYPHSRSFQSVEALSRFRGASVGVEMAEAFMVIRDLQFDT
ncbi:MAG: PIG-L family deacetylase [Gammaproteobacteria bacterium]|nr:PIG-L family deacetylase [Gammaproteobacteria bacterium]